MNTSQVIIGLAASIGVLLIGWYLYMQQTPSYERTFKRGLEVQAVDSSKGAATPVKPAPKPQTIPAKAVDTPAKTGAAPEMPKAVAEPAQAAPAPAAPPAEPAKVPADK